MADQVEPGTDASVRRRRTKAEMDAFRGALYAIVEAKHPCSVRQVYYVGIGKLWQKDTGGDRTAYNDVVRNLGMMRESELLPWGWLTDSTRYVRIDDMYDDLGDALAQMQVLYRRNIWATQPRRVEVWAESDSTASLIESVTRPLGIGLYSCRGQAGKEFAHAAAVKYQEIGKPVTILYVGDWDPSGLAIPRSLEERLNRYVKSACTHKPGTCRCHVEIELRRLAVTPEQITEQNLQTHDVNAKDSSYNRFVEQCRLVGLAEQAVEVEAIDPPVLRNLVYDELTGLIDDPDAWHATLDYEEAEREQLAAFIEGGLS